ncbi:cohesin domain-containing protein [Cohnella phaseoli]|uniref:Cohesin domain-containing protein n=1 Tax=Cohnella phaseoli TaxID=456490 RepID=A0A3D9KI53_9BACL|nr:cohesin domain-containing protein [Cohnella phaseoli]RED86221.1 cohesin domain-containing protein [Cohnella phaseoli]
MKKLIMVLMAGLLLASGVGIYPQVGHAAIDYSGGYLDGQPYNLGSDENTIKTTTYLLTDNNEATSVTMSKWVSSGTTDLDHAIKNFGTAITVNAFRLKASANMQIYFYDEANKNILVNGIGRIDVPTSQTDGSLVQIPPTSGIRKVVLFNPSTTSSVSVSEFQIYNLSAPAAPILNASPSNSKVDLAWNGVSVATGYNVKRSLTPNGPYTTIRSNLTTTTFSDADVINGTTYYYIVTALNAIGESEPSNEASATPTASPILNVVIENEKIKVGEQFTSDIVLENVSNIYAEDFKIDYDSNLLNFIGFEEVPGYKIYNQPTDENGKLRFIIASHGEQYGITGDKVFLKLKFSGKAKGTAKVDALECRIADTESEYDLNEDSCLEDSIVIEGIKDVNRTGEYTLVDLAIDGFYFGKTVAQTDLSKHDADQVEDGIVDDNDLVFIVNEILNNPNYPLNA